MAVAKETRTAVQTAGLRRSFGQVQAVAGLDVSVPAGEVVALVGPNGAGKTTLLLILAGLLAPDGGSARVGGLDPVAEPFEVHRIVGWMPISSVCTTVSPQSSTSSSLPPLIACRARSGGHARAS